MEYIEYKWSELDDDIFKISNWIKTVKFVPSAIIGLSKTGNIPATILSNVFDCPVTMVDVVDGDVSKVGFRTLDQLAGGLSHNKKFIIIDSSIECGRAMASVKERLYPSNGVLYVTLWFNPNQNNIWPNFWARIIDRGLDNRRIEFPYG